MNDVKAGYQTTEFWTTLAAAVFSVLLAGGVITTADAANLSDSVGKIIAAVAAIVTSGTVVVQYIQGRIHLKEQAAFHAQKAESPKPAPPLP